MATNLKLFNHEAESQISKTSEGLDSLKDNIIEIPHSLALLGQIMLQSTQCDFSLISKPRKQPLQGAEETIEEAVLFGRREDFKCITHPESFRATLVQVSNAGYQAFLAAHTNMDKIRLTCDNAQEHVEFITECIIEGEDSDIITMVPVSLQSILKTAQECAKWSREICSKFHNTLKLLEEINISCQKAQMTNQEKLNELERQKKELAFEKEEAEKNKQEEQKKKEEIEKNMDEEREAFRKESQHRVTELKKKVIPEEEELKKYKLEQQKANKNLEEELLKEKGWYDWMLRKQTKGVVAAENGKSKIDDQVRNQERLVNTKSNKVDEDIKCEENILNKEEEIWKSDEARCQNASMGKLGILSNQISEARINLNSTEREQNDKEDIKQLIKDGIKKVAKAESHWRQLVVFFEEISNVTEVAMGKAIDDFADAAKIANENLPGEVALGSRNSMKIFTKKRLIQLAFKAYSRCNGVSTVSKTYLKISNTYLMPSIIQLRTLLAIDAEGKPEKIKSKEKEIKCRSEKTKEFIEEVVSRAKIANEDELKMKASEYQ